VNTHTAAITKTATAASLCNLNLFIASALIPAVEPPGRGASGGDMELQQRCFNVARGRSGREARFYNKSMNK
jgi:hypothetical protein